MFVSLAEESMWLLTYIDVIGVDIVGVGITEQRVQFHPVTVIWNTITWAHFGVKQLHYFSAVNKSPFNAN